MFIGSVFQFFSWNSFQDCHNISSIQKDGGSFHQETEIIFKEETSEMLRRLWNSCNT